MSRAAFLELDSFQTEGEAGLHHTGFPLVDSDIVGMGSNQY